MMVATATIYDTYAPIYDAIGQAQFGARMAAWTLHWLAERGERPEQVLDLACGTGEAALVFAAAGCAVVGIDQSASMLEIAQGKARDASYDVSFVQANIRELEPRAKSQEPRTKNQEPRTENREQNHFQFSIFNFQFDLVTCFYDSLNYLTEDGDLDRVFAGAAAALRPGGCLVFDLNTATEFATWDERDTVTYDGRDCLVYNKLSYDSDTRLATGRIVWFVREIERWWRGEETHIERAWSAAEVRAALANAGLSMAEQVDAAGTHATDDATRVIYVARRLNTEGAER